MSTQTVQTAGVAAMPRVNLMPPEIAEAERFRRLQLAMGGAVVLSAVVVGFLYHNAKSGISSAQAELATAQQQQTSLNAKLQDLSSVSQTYDSVHAKQVLLQQAMGQEVRWSYVLNDLSFRIPSNVWLTAVQAEETAADPAATLQPGGTPGAIGSVLFNVTAYKHNDVATWLDSLAKEKGFANPSFSSSNETVIGTRGVVSATTSTDLTSDALSNRYTPKAGS
ncbi:MAG: PilN domain-containing protein [Frankiaceae bacterium]|nr:PilN domain-containing protein [Frankiaceae bacterium]MBV9872424.1 PilN domain-containing protein [Frankiaceae bacterium]